MGERGWKGEKNVYYLSMAGSAVAASVAWHYPDGKRMLTSQLL